MVHTFKESNYKALENLIPKQVKAKSKIYFKPESREKSEIKRDWKKSGG